MTSQQVDPLVETLVLEPQPQALLELYNADATANAIEDMFIIDKQTSSTAASGIGTGMIFQIEDGGGSEEQASLDVALTTVTDSSEDADIIFSQNTGGTIKETLRLIAAEDATTADQLQYTSNTDETNGIVDIMTLKLDSTGTGANNIGAGLAIQLEDAGGVEEQASLDFQLTDATNASEDTSLLINLNQSGTITSL